MGSSAHAAPAEERAHDPLVAGDRPVRFRGARRREAALSTATPIPASAQRSSVAHHRAAALPEIRHRATSRSRSEQKSAASSTAELPHETTA
jgi:hypothetical protein